MGKVISICCSKGGTGKTTTAANLAEGLTRKGFKVLAVNLDPQGDFEKLYSVRMGLSAYECIKAKRLEPTELKRGLFLLPSGRDLAALDMTSMGWLSQEIRKASEQYHYIIIDTPPTMGVALIAALQAADCVVIPTEPEYLAISGTLELVEVLRTLESRNGRSIEVRALMAKYDKRKALHRLCLERVGNGPIRTFETMIRTNVTIAEAQVAQIDLYTYAPTSKGAEDYAALTDEVARLWKVKK